MINAMKRYRAITRSGDLVGDQDFRRGPYELYTVTILDS
jgi:hypothetical protein